LDKSADLFIGEYKMTKLKITLASFALIAFAGIAIGQSGLWPNFPIVGGSSYSCGSVNGVSNCTVPAGPTTLTGNETIPANTNLSQGRSPQNVLIKPANLNANPLTFVTVTTPPTGISASNIEGGIVYTSATTITSANITLPASAIHGQQFRIASNRTITTLTVDAASGDSIATNSNPTALSVITTSPNNYTFICDKTSLACVWKRLQ
jgi:hypothetical protein